MIGTGIIYHLRSGKRALPKILRYVYGEKSSFPMHVGEGERLLITDEDVFFPSENGMTLPDPVKAKRVLKLALKNNSLRTIQWQL